MRIPCKTISLISDNVQLIENLPTEILETVVTSKRILSCIPASSLERLVAQSRPVWTTLHTRWQSPPAYANPKPARSGHPTAPQPGNHTVYYTVQCGVM